MTKERFKLIPAVHLLLIRENRILLLRRYKTGWMDGSYSVPAGHLDGDESATTAMIREAAEEAGLTIKDSDLTLGHLMHRHCPEGKINERIDFFFVAKEWQGEPKVMEQDKCDDLSWYSLNELPQNMISYVRVAIEKYARGQLYSEFEWPK
jgi:8-oxo-dGTP pyrophosphatase MutT (NUDIX family)